MVQLPVERGKDLRRRRRRFESVGGVVHVENKEHVYNGEEPY